MTEPNGAVEVQSLLELMSPQERVRAAGVLLFVAAEPVAVTSLARHLGCGVSETRAVLVEVAAAMHAVGLVVQWTDDDHVQLSSAPDEASLVRQFLGQEKTVKLSQAALETVALIAYRQPVTRSDIEAVRGVDSSGVLQTLLARGLVEPVGRLPTVGTPNLYATTPEFLRLFGLTSLGELPELSEDLVAKIDERSEVSDIPSGDSAS